MSRPDRITGMIPDGSGGIRSVERPMPRPGRDEVLIRVVAAGVGRADLRRVAGTATAPSGGSDLLGLEVSGIVEELGRADTTSLATPLRTPSPGPGDRVCALVPGGGYADYVVAPRSCVLPVPGDLDMVEAAALPQAAFAVWDNLVVRGELDRPKAVLIHAGGSGVGTLAIQIARVHDCRIFATAGTPDRRAACETLGAERAFDHRDPDWPAAVLGQSGGIDVILDLIGASRFRQNLRVLAPEGRMVGIGFVGGTLAELDLQDLARRRLTLTGATLEDRNPVQLGLIAEAVYDGLWPRIARREVEPIIHTTFPLAEAGAALDLLAGDTVIGRLVLEVDPELCAPVEEPT